MNRLRPTKGRRPPVNTRRLRFEERGSDEFGGFESGSSGTGRAPTGSMPNVSNNLPMVRRPAVGWDHSGSPEPVGGYRGGGEVDSPLAARVLALLSDPRIDFLTVSTAADALGHPRQRGAQSYHVDGVFGKCLLSGNAFALAVRLDRRVVYAMCTLP